MLTQAWCKFTECVNRYDLVDGNALNSAHLCEAPGAFVAALNHHIQSRCDGSFEWGWVANTLNPYYEGNPTSQVPFTSCLCPISRLQCLLKLTFASLSLVIG